MKDLVKKQRQYINIRYNSLIIIIDRYDHKQRPYRLVIIVIIIIVVLLWFQFGILFIIPTKLYLPADMLVFTRGIFSILIKPE